MAHLQCTGCRTWLMYAYGARSVKCAICDAITRTSPDSQAAGASGAGEAGPPAPDPSCVVQVENPATLDDDGNEVRRSRPLRLCFSVRVRLCAGLSGFALHFWQMRASSGGQRSPRVGGPRQQDLLRTTTATT